jgi:hypothetical protein
MVLTKIGTRKGTTATDVVVVIEIDGQQASLQKQDLTTHDTPAKIKAEMERQVGKSLPLLFTHINRDGSVATAYGEEPTLWPEDEKE